MLELGLAWRTWRWLGLDTDSGDVWDPGANRDALDQLLALL
jgi:hypothetical protein